MLAANKRRGLEGAPLVISGPRLPLYGEVEVMTYQAALARAAEDSAVAQRMAEALWEDQGRDRPLRVYRRVVVAALAALKEEKE